MTLKEQLEQWLDGINSGSSATDLGIVADPLYDEHQVVLNNYLGITKDYVNNTVTVNHNASGIKTDIVNTSGTVVPKEW